MHNQHIIITRKFGALTAKDQFYKELAQKNLGVGL
jgi:hypothetical protein